MNRRGHLWALVLAAGEGTRLRALTVDASGLVTPKQYCRFGSSRSMLGWTIDRAERLVPRDRVVTVVAAGHRRWWSSELAGRTGPNVVVQPENRGTAVGLLLGLRQILRRDRQARLMVLPSDHYVADEETLRGSWIQAIEALHENDDRVVLLGMTADGYDPDYGWIVSSPAESGTARPVVCFREKPDRASAAHLIERGALVSTFMLSATGVGLQRLYADAQPDLLEAFAPLAEENERGPDALAALYEGLPTRDFSRDILERRTERLVVVSVPPCGWSDLGTPARLARYLRSRLELAPGGAPGGRGVLLAPEGPSFGS